MFYRADWAARYRESRETGRPVRFEYGFQAGTGPRALSATVRHIPGAPGKESRFAYVVDDVTAQRRPESAQAAQHAASRVLAGSADLADAIPRLLEAVGGCLGMDLGEYWDLDEAAGLLRPGAAWSARGAGDRRIRAASRTVAFAQGKGLPGRVWQTRSRRGSATSLTTQGLSAPSRRPGSAGRSRSRSSATPGRSA